MRTSTLNRLCVSLTVCSILFAAIGPAKPAAARPLTDTPIVFASEEDYVINDLVVRGGTVFWGSSCALEGQNRALVRSKPAGDGPIHTLFEEQYPPHSDNCYLPGHFASFAVDESHAYWIDSHGRLVKQRRSAVSGELPTVVMPQAAWPGYFGGTEVAVDSTYLYWLGRASSSTQGILRMPKSGGAPLVIWDDLTNWPTDLRVDEIGNVYFLHRDSSYNSGTLYRATVGDIITRIIVGTVGRVQAYTVDATHIFWIESSTEGSSLLVRSAPLATPASVTTLYTIPGTDHPRVSFMAVDPANLYWVETYPDRSEDIVRMPRASNWPTVVAVPASNYGVRLLFSSDRYLFWIADEGVYRLPVTASLPDLVVQDPGLEVVQVIQAPGSDVPLTKGKDTFVRLYGRLLPGNTGITNVAVSPSAALYGVRNGVALPGSPLQPIQESSTFTNQAPDRRSFDNSVLFRLPPDWTDGTVYLTGTLNPKHTVPESNRGNNTAGTVVTFQYVPSYCLWMVPVETTAGTLKGPGSVSPAFFDRAVSLWPVSHFEISFDGGPAQRRPRPFFFFGSDPYALDSELEMYYLLWNLWWTYWFNHGYACLGAGTVVVAAVPEIPHQNIRGMAGFNVLLFQALPDGSSWNAPLGGRTLAHELGHILGREHVDCPIGEPASPDPAYPYPSCQIDYDHPTRHVGLDSMTRSLVGPAAAGDLMSYSPTRWTSDYTYRALIQRLQGNARTVSVTEAATDDKLLIGGMLGSAPLISYAFKVNAAEAAELAYKLNAATQPSQSYQLRTYDSAGNLIATAPLSVMSVQTESSTEMSVFFNLVDTTPAPARFEVRQVSSGQVVVARSAGTNPPSLAIVEPASGTTPGARLDIAWSATDPDGDPLLFTVRYSSDYGSTWQVLGSQTSEQSFSVETAGLPGGSEALVEVIASDGVHSTAAIAGPFRMPYHAPQVAILDSAYQPIDGGFPAAVLQSETTHLRAQAYDTEDGMLSGTALQWRVTGPVSRFATGEKLRLEGLPPGSYQATLQATDSNGARAQAVTVLTVAPKRVFDSTSPALDGYCDDLAYADDQDPIKIRYEDGTVAEARLARAADGLYACLAGLPLGEWTSSFAAVLFDLNNSGDPQAMPDDLSFMVSQDGVTSTSAGDGQGGFTSDTVPQGLTAAVSHSEESWNAELRIATSRLGGWSRLVRMRVGHYWRNHVGDDIAWPANQGWNSPASWGMTAFGQLAQTITFAALPDQLATDPPFALSATTSSGLQPVYAPEGACTILGNIVTLRGPGRCTITASQPGNASYAAASPVMRSFSVRARVFLPVILR